MTEQPAVDPITEMLARVPEDVALYLRDLFRGLEAEAGNARATATEIQRELDGDIARLRLFAAGLQADLETAESERDDARRDLAAARLELAERAEPAVKEPGRRGWMSR